MVEQPPIREQLKALRERAGFSVRAIAEAIGKGHSTYAAYESKRYKKSFLPPDLVELLVPVLGSRGIQAADVRSLAFPDAPVDERPHTNVQFSHEVTPSRTMIPILGSAEAGDGTMAIAGEIGYVQAPPDFDDIQGAFALHVVGDSMEPVMEHGWVIFLSPLPPSSGQFCLFEMRGDFDHERSAVVKRLRRTYSDRYEVSQYNPAKTYDIPKADVIVARTITHIKPR